ncbi:MAG TPA: amidase, partial [Pyrinomonadaceae bacterium]|nr:amidase [Pyrinomonadaceae bacterium]
RTVEETALLEELTQISATELAHLIRGKQASPVEVAQAYLKRLERLNPCLNAIVTIAPDFLEMARQAEASLMSGDVLGPLHGVPITIKDTIETAGLRSTSGSAMRAQFVPEHDAPSVARLKNAGAIILGKTNAAEMAMDYTADNPVFGRTNNPHDTSRTPGGSSGGEAAAIATCMSAGGLGSDLAGSIRIPAHFCGIAGLKPTTGSVPSAGQFPPSIGPYSLGAAIGPMARRVEDLRLLLSALRGAATPKVTTGSDSLLNKSAAMRGCRVAWYTDDEVAPVTEETRRAVARAASALNDAGLIAEQRRPPGVERGYELWLNLFSRASVAQLRNVYTGREEEGGAFVRWRLATADDTPPPKLDDYISAWMERDRLRLVLDQWMTEVPLLVAPVGATPALKHDTLKVTIGGTTLSTFRAFSYSQAFNVFDLPSVSVPAGVSAEGLPIGVQIVGRPFAEEAVLVAAAIVEEALGGWKQPKLCDNLLVT